MTPILGIMASGMSGNLWAPGKDFDSIATVTLTSSTTGITFSSIPQTYRHLQLRFLAKGNNAGTLEYLGLQYNGATSSYNWHQLYGDGSTATATNFAQGFIRTFISGASGTSMFAGGVIDILDYTNTTNYKTARLLSGTDQNGAGFVSLSSGAYYGNTNAITSLYVYGVNNTLLTGTTVALYGIK